MENNTQQQPRVVNPEDVFKMAFSNTEETTQQSTTELPLPPTDTTAPPVIEPSNVTPPTEEQPAQEVKTDFSKKINEFIGAGLIEDFAITVDGEEVYLSEVDIKDEDTYNTLLEQIKSEKEKQLKEKYIPKEGLDSTTEKLIEIRKAGGDITEIIKENVAAIDQLQRLKNTFEEGEDKEKEQLAINIVAQNLQQKGLTDRVIQVQLQDYIESGVIEDEANKILDSHLELHSQAIEQKKQQEIERASREKEEAKVFKKTLSTKYKEWNIPESITKVLVENATRADEYQITNTDKLFFDAKQNPELFAKLNFFLNNPQEFEKWVSSKKVLEAKKEVVKSSITINTSKTRPTRQTNINNIDDLAEQAFNK